MCLKIKRALISVHDKTGIVEFARGLVELGIEIISTGGTAALLKENTVPVTLVEEITGFPEMLDGRVKTLHPKIHAAILADRDNPEHMQQLAEQGIEPIDMVVVNLYPFAKTVADPDTTFEQAIEMIDIGGPCLLRAAAKNQRGVVVISDQAQFDMMMERLASDGGVVDEDTRFDLAEEAFDITASYDQQINSYLAGIAADRSGNQALPHMLDRLRLPVRRLLGFLRYGENPHQNAAAYHTEVMSPYIGGSVVWQQPLDDMDMSFNNYADADAALGLCSELSRGIANSAVAVFVKHANPCGVGLAADSVDAYRRAYLGDPLAAMGGVLALNTSVDRDTAIAVMESLHRWGKSTGASAFFVDVWIAPDFDSTAIEAIRQTKKWGQRVRLLTVGDIPAPPDDTEQDFKRIAGGLLIQDRDRVGLNEDQWRVVTKRAPTDLELNDLRLTWLICKHTKSNAISICKDGLLIGNGAGQMSRVMSCRIATWLAQENGHADKLSGAAAASDAFFPFRDGPDLLIEAGVQAIIQPGGSKRDAETIAACNEHGVAMIFTGTRHFKH
ncbi:MAG: bifunctional phosphoribosylaminoimidazolecarboxamide formyltransferase/IMP cyclohydrolase [Planctomycetes bacterium]|nr:bifunctional phosphoribosylaminoimidazolecarboxamide formyltransferase/IMP cyclohydrolase [Planctomycetota bacterium]